jgi:hypothetical protein
MSDEAHRLTHVPPVPLAELRPNLAEPPQASILAAMRAVPTALSESHYAGDSWLPSDPSDRSILHPVWLAHARKGGHGRAAAEWAIYRLAESGRLSVVWPSHHQHLTGELLGRWVADLAERLRGGRPAEVTDWDLCEGRRVLEIRSTPALWAWFTADCPASHDPSAPPDAAARDQTAGPNRSGAIPEWVYSHFRQQQQRLLSKLWGSGFTPADELIAHLKYRNPTTGADNLRRRVTEANNGLLEKVSLIGEQWEITQQTRGDVVGYILKPVNKRPAEKG